MSFGRTATCSTRPARRAATTNEGRASASAERVGQPPRRLSGRRGGADQQGARFSLEGTEMFTNMSYRAATAALVLLGFAGVARAQQVVELLPNIRALPAFEVSTRLHPVFQEPELRFSVTTANVGDGPLEFVGGETGRGKQNIYQRVYLSDGTFYDRRVGAYVWHPEHNHIHVENYAEYTLQALNAPGNSKRTGQKTSFCVMDTDKYGALGSNQPQYTTCENTVQGMSVGWGDTYHSRLAGQEIDLTGLPDGDYTLS